MAVHKLTAAVLKLGKPGAYGDGNGLWLQISKGTGGRVYRSWTFRFTDGRGRRREMGLGSVSLVPLSEARELALKYRRQRLAGVDPLEERNAERAERRAAAASVMTFDECVAEYLRAHRDEWRNEKHRKQWDSALRRNVSPIIGKLPVARVDTPVLTKALLRFWDRTPSTASRVRGRIEAVLDWATVSGFRHGENPARWGGHLEHILPSPRKLQPVAHHAAMPYRDVPAFMSVLRGVDSFVARALEFLILTATRSLEARGARWDEIDLAERIWTIPSARMKVAREHRIPLSAAAVSIITERLELKHADLVFPSHRSGEAVSDNTLRLLMKSLGHGSFTVHGFRSAFRDWAGESTNFAREIAEAALAHRTGNAVEQAYRRGDALEKRRRLMQAWSDYCAQPVPATSATITPIRKGEAHA
jgi:integrase